MSESPDFDVNRATISDPQLVEKVRDPHASDDEQDVTADQELDADNQVLANGATVTQAFANLDLADELIEQDQDLEAENANEQALDDEHVDDQHVDQPADNQALDDQDVDEQVGDDPERINQTMVISDIDLSETDAETAGGPDEDQSIENYMAALMARANGYSANDKKPGKTAKKVSPDNSDQKSPSPQNRSADSTAPKKSEKTAEPYHQKQAPERRSDLSSMRELANMNARRAIGTHAGRQLVVAMYGKLTVAAVACVISFALASLATAVASVAFFGSFLSSCAAVAWTVRYFQLSRQLQMLQPSGEQPTGEQPEPVEAAGS